MFKYQKCQGWTMASSSMAHVAKPQTEEQLQEALKIVRDKKQTVIMRSAGFSYGDEIQNKENALIDVSLLDKILDWNPQAGVLSVQPGATFHKVLNCVLKDNWVLGSVPGIKLPTMGGALNNDIHGKGGFNFKTFGNDVLGFRLLMADGSIKKCSKSENEELFFAVIGGLGLFGIVLDIQIQCIKIPSPYLAVRKWTVPNMGRLLEDLGKLRETSTYNIAWVDCFTKGQDFGRGTIHAADFVEKPAHANEQEDLSALSPYIFGFFPRTWVWPMMKPFMGNMLMQAVNTAKYHVDKLTTSPDPHIANFFQFTFLLDAIPNWRVLFQPQGYYELEPVIPFENCQEAFTKLIQLTHEYGSPTHLTAIKSHKASSSLLNYSIDGCSIGIDVPVKNLGDAKMRELFYRMNEIVIAYGGRNYLAKDELLTRSHAKKMYPAFEKFAVLKKKYDPASVFESNLYRRLFQHND